MEIKNIHSIEIIYKDCIDNCRYTVGSNNVGRIIDRSQEFSDGIEFIYDILDNEGNLKVGIVNCSAIIEYDKGEN